MLFRNTWRSRFVQLHLLLLGTVATLGLVACETTPLTQTPAAGGLIGGAGIGSAPAKAAVADGGDCKTDDDCANGHCDQAICCASGNCCRTEQDCRTIDGTAAACDEPETCQGTRGSVTCSGYRCRAHDGVEDDSGCDATTKADDCGLYAAIFCNGKADQRQPKCPTSCIDDTLCDPSAHCEDAKCVRDIPDHSECSFDSACASGHCSNGLCCKSGDCCREDADCSEAQYGMIGICDDPAHCQGHRGVPRCTAGQCDTALVEDDTGCDRNVVANDCGDGPDVKCRGGEQQGDPPPCATGTCGGLLGGGCNPEAFCWQGQCLPDQPNGEGCTDNASCQSGHCQNNVCCASGDCCENDSQCPAMNTCEDLLMCQGHRQDRYCDLDSANCVKSALVEDDSGCANRESQKDCDLNVSPLCTADADQPDAPECPRCINVPFCEHTVPAVDSSGNPTGGQVCAQDGWVEEPVGCKYDGLCESFSGRCY